jgi:drug/metabolite transporter (DMT)-like permease
MARQKKLAYLAWITVCIVWGTTYLGIAVALETMPVALLAGLRWLGAGALMAVVLPFVGQSLPSVRAWPSIAVIGFLMAVVGNGGVVWAQQYVPSGLAAVIVAMVPFWSVIVEALVPNGERVTRYTVGGLVLGFVGIIVLLWPEVTLSGAHGMSFVWGVLALQIACAGWALGTSYLKRNPTNGSPMGSLAMQMLLSGVMLVAIGTAAGEWSALQFSARSIGAMVYLVIFGSLVGYTAYLYALKNLPVSTVSLYAYVNPVIAVILGAVVLSEPFTLRTAIASVLVFAGIAIVRSAHKVPEVPKVPKVPEVPEVPEVLGSKTSSPAALQAR